MPLPLPEITPENEAYWTAGERGELRIMACKACDHRINPPQLVCPVCLSRDVAPMLASGRGTVHTFTINRQQWIPDLEVPYALAIVDLDDQPGVRITAQLRCDDLADIAIGKPVSVAFEQREEVFVPYFTLD